MSAESFLYSFTMGELRYLLFAPKVCPLCKGNLSKEKECEIIDGYSLKKKSIPLYLRTKKLKRYTYVFTCGCCGSRFSIKELSDRKGV